MAFRRMDSPQPLTCISLVSVAFAPGLFPGFPVASNSPRFNLADQSFPVAGISLASVWKSHGWHFARIVVVKELP